MSPPNKVSVNLEVGELAAVVIKPQRKTSRDTTSRNRCGI